MTIKKYFELKINGNKNQNMYKTAKGTEIYGTKYSDFSFPFKNKEEKLKLHAK